MNYYFPGLFPDSILSRINNKPLSFPFEYHLNSGENALRLVLRSFKLKPLTKVAIPGFVCGSVKSAVVNEGLSPVLFDLKNDNTFWTDYTIDNITLIHDAAQSYGINKNKLSGGPVVYSFGPGKSTTAAGGAIVDNFDNKEIFRDAIKKYSFFQEIIVRTNAKLFLKSRICNYKMDLMDVSLKAGLEKIYAKVISPYNLYPMVGMQQMLAAEAMDLVLLKKVDRTLRYQVLTDSIKNNNNLSLAFDDKDGIYFKTVLFVDRRIDEFKAYLQRNDIPFFRLFDDASDINEGNPIFQKNANKFFEISCEASIPLEEINRVADVLRSYK